MKKCFLCLFLILFSSWVISTPITPTKMVFHCESDNHSNDSVCGHDISKEINSAQEPNIEVLSQNRTKYQEEMKKWREKRQYLLGLKRRINRSDIEFNDSKYPRRNGDPILIHYYPRNQYDKESLEFQRVCYETSVEKKPLFYELKWNFNSDKWNCVRQQVSTDGAVEKVNFFKSPLTFLLYSII